MNAFQQSGFDHILRSSQWKAGSAAVFASPSACRIGSSTMDQWWAPFPKVEEILLLISGYRLRVSMKTYTCLASEARSWSHH